MVLFTKIEVKKRKEAPDSEGYDPLTAKILRELKGDSEYGDELDEEDTHDWQLEFTDAILDFDTGILFYASDGKTLIEKMSPELVIKSSHSIEDIKNIYLSSTEYSGVYEDLK